MNPRHDPAHGGRFEEWLDAGAGAAVPPELAACPECRARLDELRLVEERVHAAALEQHADLRVAAAMQAAPGDERIERFLAAKRRPPRPSRRLGWFLAVAAALLAVFLATRERAPREDSPGIELGERALEPIEPVGGVEGFERFRWRARLPGGTRFRVHVESAEGELLSEHDAGERFEWTPDPAMLDTWPARIRWWVTAESAFAVPGDPPVAESEPVEAFSRSY